MTSISLCVIARDEAEYLPRMLESVHGVVDEIIVVDTGSRDGTAEIARRAGARVIEEPFADDFSAARNTSLAAASCPWILVLDADEQLAPGTGEVLKGAIRQEGRAGFFLRFLNDLGEGRQHICGMVRLFRNRDDIRFRYLIHEQVLPDLWNHCKRTGETIAPLPEAVVHHDGYLPERCQERDKNQRNERLFRKQVEKFPEHAYSWYKFGDFLRRFEERRDEALEALDRAACVLRKMDNTEARSLSFATEVFALLAVEFQKADQLDRARALAEEGRRRFGDSPNLLYVLAHLRAVRGEHRQAFLEYARLRAWDGKLMPVPPEPGVTGPRAFFGMGRALANLGHGTAARRCLEKALEQQPAYPDARILLARLAMDRGDTGTALDQYQLLLEDEPDNAAVRLRAGTVLLHTGRPRAALVEFDRSLEDGIDTGMGQLKRGQALIACGAFDQAYQALQLARDQREAETGRLLLELMAAGGDPRAIPELGQAEAGSWLRFVEMSGLFDLETSPAQG